MDALVSGQSGLAVIIQGNDSSFLSIDTMEEERKCHPANIRYLFAGATDVLELKSTSKEAVKDRLIHEWRFDRGLHLILILLDANEDAETRAEAGDCLTTLLEDRTVNERLQNVLYSAELPNPKCASDALGLLGLGGAAAGLLKAIDNDQDKIRVVCTAWNELAPTLFESQAAKDDFRNAATKSGVFKILAENLLEPTGFALSSVECHQRLRNLPNHRAILGNWLGPIKPERARQATTRQREEARPPRVGKSPEDYRPGRETSAFEAYESVKKQKQAVITLIKKGDTHKARKFTEDLIRFQLGTGGREYAAKSLCDLAQRAKNALNYSFQLELAKRAVDLCPEDGWAHGQLADAYLCLGRYDDAVHSFNQASGSGELAFAASGLARVLWGQGRLSDALETYEKAQKQYPDDPQIWNGRAEVLREMWRYEESLRAYEESVGRFPTDPVSICGKATVLKDLGRLEESLNTYREAIQLFPDELFVRDGLADVLRGMGRLHDSLDAYEKTISLFPEDSVARCGRAEVLRDMGLLDESLRYYEETIHLFPYVPVPYCGRAEVLKDMGLLSDALVRYEDTILRFPLEARAHNGRANVLRKMGRVTEALQAFDRTIRQFPYDIFALSGRAASLKELGKLPEALEAYEVLLNRNPTRPHLRHAKAAILAVLRRYKEAESLLPENLPQTRDDWIGYHLRGMILLKRDMIRPAIKHFEEGLAKVPFADQRRYLQKAIVVATIRQRRFHEAAERLGLLEDATTEILRLHTCGELDRIDEASMAYERLRRSCPTVLIPLRNELAAKYAIRNEKPRHDETWIFEEECSSVLLEAA